MHFFFNFHSIFFFMLFRAMKGQSVIGIAFITILLVALYFLLVIRKKLTFDIEKFWNCDSRNSILSVIILRIIALAKYLWKKKFVTIGSKQQEYLFFRAVRLTLSDERKTNASIAASRHVCIIARLWFMPTQASKSEIEQKRSKH